MIKVTFEKVVLIVRYILLSIRKCTCLFSAMFLGSSLVALVANASLVNFLSKQLPDQKDSDGIFDKPFSEYYDFIVGKRNVLYSLVKNVLAFNDYSTEFYSTYVLVHNQMIEFQIKNNTLSYEF